MEEAAAVGASVHRWPGGVLAGGGDEGRDDSESWGVGKGWFSGGDDAFEETSCGLTVRRRIANGSITRGAPTGR